MDTTQQTPYKTRPRETSFLETIEEKAKTLEPLPLSFYEREDVVLIARELLGKTLFTEMIPGTITGGIITETEAYKGIEDKACHAYNNRRTPRTEVMYQRGGISYVYLCYGMHHLLNIVTNTQDIPHAVLIRAIYPCIGVETMLKRRNKSSLTKELTSGPGALSQALGITKLHNGLSLLKKPLWIQDIEINLSEDKIQSSARIGVDYAKEHAKLPWRFTIDPATFS